MIKVSSLKKNPKNPRQIRDEKFEKLKASIQEFPQMMALRPMIVDETNTVLGGNMRLNAIKALGMTEIPDEWVKKASDLTEDQKKEFVIKDNSGFGEYDWDAIANEWSDLPLTDWGLDVPGFEEIEPEGDADADGGQDDTGLNYQTQFGVIVICADEHQQQGVFEELSAKGLNCKIVVT